MRPFLRTAASWRAWSRLLFVSERLASSSAASGCRRTRLSTFSVIFMEAGYNWHRLLSGTAKGSVRTLGQATVALPEVRAWIER
jgi:hypothetical protein